jgi:hypothetical protein
LLIDVINPFTFDGATALLRFALPAARRIRALKERARAAQLPIVYVNDNFGQWQSDFRSTVRHCATSGRAAEIVTLLRPQADDYFVLKPRHSGFYLTPLDSDRLRHQHVRVVYCCRRTHALLRAVGSVGLCRRRTRRPQSLRPRSHASRVWCRHAPRARTPARPVIGPHRA